MNGTDYKAFITYSHRDSKVAAALQKALESYRVPSRLVGKQTPNGAIASRIGAVFRDREDLSASGDLSKSINDALANSEFLIVVCSPAARASRWVNLEISEFRKLHGDDRILCYIADGEPFAVESGHPDSLEGLPPALGYIDSDGEKQSNVEPMAADSRPVADGRRLARLKIISGRRGIRLDELIQRDAQRRTWRMAAVTSGSLFVAAFTLLLAVVAIDARDEADEQRDQAENLLSFMVIDLRNSLEPIGRLDLLEQVGNQAMKYFASVELEDLTQLGALRQIEVLTQIGQIRLAQLLNDDALESFTSAYERGLQLSMADPADQEALFQRSQSEYWIGATHVQGGDMTEATAWWTRYRDSSIELSQLDPDNSAWQREVGYGFHNLGILALRNQDFETAVGYFDEELEIVLRLSDEDPENVFHVYDLGDITSWLGRAYFQQGNLAIADEYYRRSLDYLGDLTASDPDNANFRYWMANALMLSYKISLTVGNIDLASDQLTQAIAILDSLVELDPSNGEWRLARYRATTHQVEIAMIDDFDFEQLLSELDSVIEGLQSLESEGVSLSVIGERLIRPYRLHSAIIARQGRTGEAVSQLEAVLPAPHQALPGDENIVAEIARSWILIGDIENEVTRVSDAELAWRNARTVLEQIAPSSRSPNILAPWAELLERQGDNEDSTAIRTLLSSTGYYFLEI